MDELNTERLRLRRLKESDTERIYTCWASDDNVTRYLIWNTHESIEDTKKIMAVWLKDYEDPDCIRYGIELRDTGELIGMIDVVGYIDGCPNIGYVSGKKYWNKGYMSEALKALVDMLENKGFKKILIRADERNIGSNRVILKNGFKLIRKERQPLSEYKPEMTTVNYYIKDNTGIC